MDSTFLGFETLTLVPYEPNLINYDLLSTEQVSYYFIGIFWFLYETYKRREEEKKGGGALTQQLTLYLYFDILIKKRPDSRTKMNDIINMDSTITLSANACSKPTTN